MSVLEWIAIYALVVVCLGSLIGHVLRYKQGPECWCGHPADAHWHYRPGTECADCDICHEYHRG
jgi:hypothetical protein